MAESICELLTRSLEKAGDNFKIGYVVLANPDGDEMVCLSNAGSRWAMAGLLQEALGNLYEDEE